MEKIVLRADCQRCAALCCFALRIDRSNLFALDKPEGRPCPNLDSHARCSIHNDLDNLGFRGCIDFDCYGAGQRVTQKYFGGRSWQDEPGLRVPMSRMFIAMLRVHESLSLLGAAKRLNLTESDWEEATTLEKSLSRNCLSERECFALSLRAKSFFTTLSKYV